MPGVTSVVGDVGVGDGVVGGVVGGGVLGGDGDVGDDPPVFDPVPGMSPGVPKKLSRTVISACASFC